MINIFSLELSIYVPRPWPLLLFLAPYWGPAGWYASPPEPWPQHDPGPSRTNHGSVLQRVKLPSSWGKMQENVGKHWQMQDGPLELKYVFLCRSGQCSSRFFFWNEGTNHRPKLGFEHKIKRGFHRFTLICQPEMWGKYWDSSSKNHSSDVATWGRLWFIQKYVCSNLCLPKKWNPSLKHWSMTGFFSTFWWDAINCMLLEVLLF